jgi:hypothetical protein
VAAVPIRHYTLAVEERRRGLDAVRKRPQVASVGSEGVVVEALALEEGAVAVFHGGKLLGGSRQWRPALMT